MFKKVCVEFLKQQDGYLFKIFPGSLQIAQTEITFTYIQFAVKGQRLKNSCFLSSTHLLLIIITLGLVFNFIAFFNWSRLCTLAVLNAEMASVKPTYLIFLEPLKVLMKWDFLRKGYRIFIPFLSPENTNQIPTVAIKKIIEIDNTILKFWNLYV